MIAARWLGVVRHRLDTCASTNDEAAQLAKGGAAHGTIVTARHQTAGRGRGDHTWFSPADDNLYLSCVLRPDLRVADVAPVTLAAGIGVFDAVNSYGARPSLKWPNDVLVGDRKLAGILTEMSSRGQTVEHLVLGIGVNLNTASFPAELDRIATSLRLETGGRRIDGEAFLATLLQRVEVWLDRFFAGGIDAISDAWTERANVAGRRVHTAVADGIARGIDGAGALLVEDDHGVVHRVIAGDVVLR